MNKGLGILALLPPSLLVLWAMIHWGALGALDLWLFDRLQHLASLGTPAASQVLLVEIDARAPPPDRAQWRAVLERLEQLDARVIGIMDAADVPLPETRSASAPPLVLGQRLVPAHEARSLYRALAPFSAALEPPGALAGVALPTRDGGIARNAASHYRLDSGERPAFAWLMARAAGVPEAQLPEDAFGLEFSPATLTLAQVSFARARAGDLIRDMVADKAVIIALHDPASPGVVTPASTTALTLGHYQGVSLATLLMQRQITSLAAHWQLLALIVLAAAVWSLSVLTRELWRPWVLAGVLLALLILAWLMLAWLRLWIGLATPMLGAGLSFVFAIRYTDLARQRRLRELVLEGSSLIDRHRLPPAFYASDEHWGQVATLVTQLLDLKRTIFLERVPGDHRVREVKALYCSFDEINEKRRDYERSPYTEAIAENQPVLLQRYFLRPREGEEQYLLALMFSGDILGFWAFAVSPVQGLEQRRLLNAATELGRQVTELLYQRQRWQDQERRQGHLWRRLQGREAPTSLQRLLDTTFERLQRRLQVMNSVLDGISSAAILYDLFGRVVQVNARMAETLQALKLPPYELTALDLVVRLTAISLDEARLHLRSVILGRQPLQLTVTLGDETRSTYLLQLRALKTDQTQAPEMAPFELLGLLLELIDLSAAQESFRFKERLIDQLGARYRNGLETIELASSLLENPQLPPQRRADMIQMLHTNLSEIADFSHGVEEFLHRDLARFPAEHFPLSLLDAIDDVLDEVGPLCQARQIQLETQLPRIAALVKASPLHLARLLEALLRVIIEDCVDEGRVRISLQSELERLILEIDNTGLGVPDARLQEYLHGLEELESEHLNMVREVRLLVEQWGGQVTLHSEVGEGLWARLELPVFSTQSFDHDTDNEYP